MIVVAPSSLTVDAELPTLTVLAAEPVPILVVLAAPVPMFVVPATLLLMLTPSPPEMVTVLLESAELPITVA